MKQFASAETKRAFTAAIQAIEARSRAEVVVVIRHHSGTYLHADRLVAVLAAFCTLAFLLYSPYEFSLIAVLIDPVIAGVVFGLLNTQLSWVRRALTLRSQRHQRVVTAARATFFEKGIRLTQARSGLLLYLSLLEREAHVVGDIGITDFGG